MLRSPGFLMLLLATSPLAGQAVVTGAVREDGTGKPLPGVEVLIEGSKNIATTGPDGRFLLDAPTGTKVALFRMIGFHPYRLRLQLSKGDTVTANVNLVPDRAQRLDSIAVTGQPRGRWLEEFEARRSLGFGKFIDSTFLRRMEHRKVMDVLQGTPGLRFERFIEDPARPWDAEMRLVASRQTVSGACWMSILYDGAPVYREGSRSRPPDFRREFNSVADLQAIEIYRSGGEVPMEYGGNSLTCGLLLLWSKRMR